MLRVFPAQHCSGFGAPVSFDAGNMCHMPISAEKIEMQSASPLLLRDLLTVEEAAERLKLAPKTIRKLCLSRRLTAIRVQRSWRFRWRRWMSFFWNDSSLASDGASLDTGHGGTSGRRSK